MMSLFSLVAQTVSLDLRKHDTSYNLCYLECAPLYFSGRRAPQKEIHSSCLRDLGDQL